MRAYPEARASRTEEALKRNEELVKRWQHHPRVNAWLSLRQIMVNTTELTRGMSALAKQLDTPIHTHLAEGTYEVDYAISKWGLRPAEYMENIGALDAHVHAAHSVLLSLHELDLYQARDVSACHCAFNNYTMGAPRVLEMLQRKIRLGPRHRRCGNSRQPGYVRGGARSDGRPAGGGRNSLPHRSPHHA